MSDGTGAAVIFGTTGGVMEAALRSAYFLATGENPDADAFKAVRGYHKGWNEAEFDIKALKLNVQLQADSVIRESLLRQSDGERSAMIL